MPMLSIIANFYRFRYTSVTYFFHLYEKDINYTSVANCVRIKMAILAYFCILGKLSFGNTVFSNNCIFDVEIYFLSLLDEARLKDVWRTSHLNSIAIVLLVTLSNVGQTYIRFQPLNRCLKITFRYYSRILRLKSNAGVDIPPTINDRKEF